MDVVMGKFYCRILKDGWVGLSFALISADFVARAQYSIDSFQQLICKLLTLLDDAQWP